MIWSILFGLIVDLGARQISGGDILFWLLIIIHLLFTIGTGGIVFASRMIAKKPSPTSRAKAALPEYIVLSLAFDSGLVPGYWPHCMTHTCSKITVFGFVMPCTNILCAQTAAYCLINFKLLYGIFRAAQMCVM